MSWLNRIEDGIADNRTLDRMEAWSGRLLEKVETCSTGRYVLLLLGLLVFSALLLGSLALLGEGGRYAASVLSVPLMILGAGLGIVRGLRS